MNSDTKIGILGAGVEGAALAVYFSGKGFSDICVYEEKDVVDLVLPPDVSVVSGGDAFERIYDREVLFRSPGVHVNRLFEARKRGIVITSAIRYFFDNCPCRIIGVTGTKGKGTTSTLIYEILKADGRHVFLGGNIGEPPINFLDELREDSIAVLELSSFQLQDLDHSPNAAVVLMTTSDHMDYHADRQEYWDAKKQIMIHQVKGNFTVLNADYEYADEFLRYGEGEKVLVGRERWGDFGIAEVGLLGAHNRENVMAACVVAKRFGVGEKVIRRVVKEFKGLPHRLEFVREVDGVNYYNDSFSTTPETSIAAACSFDSGVLLIAGGSEKNSDYAEWARALQMNNNVKMVFLMGDTAGRMEEALRGVVGTEKTSDERGTSGVEFPVEVYRCADLSVALQMAHKMAVKGDNVVMSPAAASFGLFKNYKVRGETFRRIVGEMAQRRPKRHQMLGGLNI